MTTACRGLVTTLFFRAGFLMAALAIIAGLLGMHVVSGTNHSAGHRMPVAAADVSLAPVHGSDHSASDAGASHAGHEAGLPAAASAAVDALPGTPALCGPAGSCPGMSAVDGGCILALGAASLAAPLPTAVSGAAQHVGRPAPVLATSSYLPDSPSPGELSISRT